MIPPEKENGVCVCFLVSKREKERQTDHDINNKRDGAQSQGVKQELKGDGNFPSRSPDAGLDEIFT